MGALLDVGETDGASESTVGRLLNEGIVDGLLGKARDGGAEGVVEGALDGAGETVTVGRPLGD